MVQQRVHLILNPNQALCDISSYHLINSSVQKTALLQAYAGVLIPQKELESTLSLSTL